MRTKVNPAGVPFSTTSVMISVFFEVPAPGKKPSERRHPTNCKEEPGGEKNAGQERETKLGKRPLSAHRCMLCTLRARCVPGPGRPSRAHRTRTEGRCCSSSGGPGRKENRSKGRKISAGGFFFAQNSFFIRALCCNKTLALSPSSCLFCQTQKGITSDLAHRADNEVGWRGST